MGYSSAGTTALIVTAITMLLAVIAAVYGSALVRRKTGKPLYGTIAAVIVFFVVYGIAKAVSRMIILGH